MTLELGSYCMVFTLSIGTHYLLTILVLKLLSVDLSKIVLDEWQTV